MNEIPYHLACPFSKDVYQWATCATLKKQKALGVIVSHHILARDLIMQGLANIEGNFKTVLLIGPNHENIGKADIQTSKALWKTKFGDIAPNKELITKLQEEGLAGIEEDSFNTEHSVCGLVSFLKIYFPQAQIVPLILKGNLPKDRIEKLASFLSDNCSNCLIVGSVDFSHEVTAQQAEKNDNLSAEILTDMDIEKVNQVVSDSKPTLMTMLFYLKEKGVRNGILINQSDSSKITGNNFATVTSYLTVIYPE